MKRGDYIQKIYAGALNLDRLLYTDIYRFIIEYYIVLDTSRPIISIFGTYLQQWNLHLGSFPIVLLQIPISESEPLIPY